MQGRAVTIIRAQTQLVAIAHTMIAGMFLRIDIALHPLVDDGDDGRIMISL